MPRLMRIVGYPAFQPSSDHSVAPRGGPLLKSTICSSAAFRCASISRRALCHSLTQNPYTGVMCGLMVSPPHLKRKVDNMSQTCSARPSCMLAQIRSTYLMSPRCVRMTRKVWTDKTGSAEWPFRCLAFLHKTKECWLGRSISACGPESTSSKSSRPICLIWGLGFCLLFIKVQDIH